TFTVTNVTYNSKTGESFGIGMYNAPLHNPEDSMHFSKCIENNEPFEGYYFISNQMYEQNDYLISCFLDYEQVPFSLDGSGPELLHRVYLAPFEEKFFRFDLGRLEPGGHDCEIVALLETENHSLDLQFRRSTDFSYLGSRRVNVYANSTELPVINYSSPSRIFAQNCGDGYVINDGLLLTRTPCVAEGWFTEDVRAGETLVYYVNVASDSKYPVSVALVALLDYTQVPLLENDTSNAIFLNLAAGEKISFPAYVQVPATPGVHELMVLYFPVPYTMLESSPGESVKIDQWTCTEPSIRIGLNVSEA
ncbi:MAG TPA: hypothetical protein PKY15_01900, partial [Methanoregulaceae archaeon]|nr:hypothetical protein [Methanoregulaceae archaeon]